MGDAVPPREELPRGPESAGQLRGPRQDGGTRLMIVFPAVDIQGGKAVRLRRGDFDDVTVFGDDPVALACFWQDQGAEALHVVDLDAARTGEVVNVDILERIVKSLDIPVQYGGGIEVDDVEGLGALVLPETRQRDRVVAEHGDVVEVAAPQADGLAALDVDSREHDHEARTSILARSTKLASRLRPTRELFSGWNCIAHTLSRATAATTCPP